MKLDEPFLENLSIKSVQCHYIRNFLNFNRSTNINPQETRRGKNFKWKSEIDWKNTDHHQSFLLCHLTLSAAAMRNYWKWTKKRGSIRGLDSSSKLFFPMLITTHYYIEKVQRRVLSLKSRIVPQVESVVAKFSWANILCCTHLKTLSS